VLTGYLPSTRGKVVVAGHDINSDAMAVRRSIGYLPEQPPLYLDMTVEDYLRFVGRIKGLPVNEVADAMDRVIDTCGLVEMRDRLIRKLSKGYRQRTGLAQALIHDPPVLILDEPTIGLDPRQISEIRRLIKNLAGDHTVILSTHILPEVALTCQRVVIINRGEIMADDTVDNTVKEGDLERQFLRIVEEAEAPPGPGDGGVEGDDGADGPGSDSAREIGAEPVEESEQ